MQAFSSAIRRTFVQYFTRFQLTARRAVPRRQLGFLFIYVFHEERCTRSFTLQWRCGTLTANSCVVAYSLRNRFILFGLYNIIRSLSGMYICLLRFLPRELCSRGICHGRVSVCLSVCVCPSQVGVLLKWLNVGTRKQRHTIAQGL